MTVTSMLDKVLKIATRQSPLALWQAQYVKARLEQAHPGLKVELVPMVTRGDVILDTPLAKVGGKGLFVKELELAMLEGRADIAVHSMKDVPVEFPEGLGLVTICERDDPRDAFVSNRYASIDELPAGSVVGTSSLRRQCQLAATRPDLAIRSLRGNVGTRLSKLDNGEYDAIIRLRREALPNGDRGSLLPGAKRHTAAAAGGEAEAGGDGGGGPQAVLVGRGELDKQCRSILGGIPQSESWQGQGGLQGATRAFFVLPARAAAWLEQLSSGTAQVQPCHACREPQARTPSHTCSLADRRRPLAPCSRPRRHCVGARRGRCASRAAGWV